MINKLKIDKYFINYYNINQKILNDTTLIN
jgi:hypothetical protein